MFFCGNKVTYVGNKFRTLSYGDRGEICAHVQNCREELVVDMDGAGSYVIHESDLIPYNQSLFKPREKKEDRKDLKVEHRHKKSSAKEEE